MSVLLFTASNKTQTIPVKQKPGNSHPHLYVSRPDYCNFFFFVCSSKSLQTLQVIRNTTARTGTTKHEKITHILSSSFFFFYSGNPSILGFIFLIFSLSLLKPWTVWLQWTHLLFITFLIPKSGLHFNFLFFFPPNRLITVYLQSTFPTCFNACVAFGSSIKVGEYEVSWQGENLFHRINFFLLVAHYLTFSDTKRASNIAWLLLFLLNF